MVRRTYADLPGWKEDDHAQAMRAFLIGAERMARRSPTSRPLGPESEALVGLGARALDQFAGGSIAREDARRFFEDAFEPQKVDTDGFVTGYFEPVVEARRDRDDLYRIPILRRPADLIELPENHNVRGLAPDMRFARSSEDGPVPYHDRSAIEGGAIDDQGLEIAWLRDPVDAFFIHVQGCATLVLADGERLRITYDGKSGHPYTSIGRVAARRGLSEPPAIDKARLEAWLRADMNRAAETMRENRSYIFFRETCADPRAERLGATGPVAAARVPLSAGRSLAVDFRLWTFQAPIFVRTLTALPGTDAPLARLMFAQDTGSAIRGPARGDIFCGVGNAAGQTAGQIAQEAEFVRLVPREA